MNHAARLASLLLAALLLGGCQGVVLPFCALIIGGEYFTKDLGPNAYDYEMVFEYEGRQYHIKGDNTCEYGEAYLAMCGYQKKGNATGNKGVLADGRPFEITLPLPCGEPVLKQHPLDFFVNGRHIYREKVRIISQSYRTRED